MSGPSLSDVPDRYDVVFELNDGTLYGFLLADSVESNLPFRTHKALYSYSPTFLERQNVSQQYGDNFQDFFLTGTQVDFSEGENQKFFRVNDSNSVRKYWNGKNVDPVTSPGNTKLTIGTDTLALSPLSVMTTGGAIGGSFLAADASNLYSIVSGSTTTSTSFGAHGAGTPKAIVDDGSNVYIAGSTALRKYDGASFTTFNSGVFNSLVFVNNILYAYQASTSSLISFDSSGTPTTQFQWKNADGTVPTYTAFMCVYGGSIYIATTGIGTSYQLWQYDGSGARTIADFNPEFIPVSMCVSNGIVFIGGHRKIGGKPGGVYQVNVVPTVYYYANGSVGKLWEYKGDNTTTNTSAPMCPYNNGILFFNTVDQKLMQYDLETGGVHSVADMGVNVLNMATAIKNGSVGMYTSSNFYTYNIVGNYNSTGYIQTSQYDFDNTLSKVIRGLKVDADTPANTSVDLSYQLDGCGGTYTSLQTGITSGTEYLLPASTSAHSISVQVTLNSTDGSATPTLKRVYVRAAPTLQQFRRREFLFDLSGGLREEIGKTARRNRDGTPYPYNPKTAAENLRTIATQTIPFTVQDRFDQFTCLADLQQNQEGYDGFAIYEIRPEVFIGRINLREV